jgi:hypothetical protein
MDALVYSNDRFRLTHWKNVLAWAEANGYEVVGEVRRDRYNRIDSLKIAADLTKERGWKLIVYCTRPLLTEAALRLLVGTDFVCPDLPDVTPKRLPALIRAAERDPGRGKRFPPGWNYRVDNAKRKKHLVEARKAAAQARDDRAGEGYKKVIPIIREKRAKGWTFQRIAEHLNERGYSLPSGHEFSVFAVMRINKQYC